MLFALKITTKQVFKSTLFANSWVVIHFLKLFLFYTMNRFVRDIYIFYKKFVLFMKENFLSRGENICCEEIFNLGRKTTKYP